LRVGTTQLKTDALGRSRGSTDVLFDYGLSNSIGDKMLTQDHNESTTVHTLLL